MPNALAGDQPVADVPMTLLGGRVAMIQIDIGTRHGLNVIVDTGASDEILDAALAKELAIKFSKSTMVAQPGGAVPMGQTTGVDLVVGGVTLKSWPFVTAPLRSLEPLLGRPFDGILGRAFFEKYVVEFDYAGSRLRLYEPAQFRYAGSGSVLPMERPGGRLFVRARLEGAGAANAEGLLQLDTGSFEALGLEGPDVQRLGLVSADAPRAPLFGTAIGGETSGYRTRFRAVAIGPYRIDRPIVSVTTSSNASNDPAGFGVVGGEVLRRFKVFVVASAKQIVLEPTPALSEACASDASGLVLISPRPFTSVLVHAVIAGSPGSEVGLRAGDELVAVDRELIAAQSLERVAGLFVIPNRTYVLKIRRSGSELSVPLTTRPPV